MKISNLTGFWLAAATLAGCATAPRTVTHTIAPGDSPAAPVPSESATRPRVESSEPARLQDTAAPANDAPPASAAAPASDDEWRFVISPYGWLLSVDGNATVNGQESIIDEDFDDIFDNLNFVAEARFEAWKGKWGMMADITYAELESDVEFGPTKGDTNTDIVLAFFGGQLRFVDQKYTNAPGGVTVDALAGAAYTSIDAKLKIDDGPNFDGDKDWVDPIVGLRSRFQVTENWGGSLETIIGGFGLTDGSDLVTMNTAMVGRRLGKGHLYFGWRTLDIDYEDGSDFKMNININGPIIGYELGF